jgi:hypothetical protein
MKMKSTLQKHIAMLSVNAASLAATAFQTIIHRSVWHRFIFWILTLSEMYLIYAPFLALDLLPSSVDVLLSLCILVVGPIPTVTTN